VRYHCDSSSVLLDDLSLEYIEQFRLKGLMYMTECDYFSCDFAYAVKYSAHQCVYNFAYELWNTS